MFHRAPRSPARAALLFGLLLFGLPTAARAAEPDQLAALSLRIDAIWVLTTAALVFLMQTGFLMVEAGLVRQKNAVITALKNVIDWMTVSVAFFVVGFGLMFGTDWHGALGADNIPIAMTSKSHPLGWSFVIFQLAFAGTAATIVSGAMAERTTFGAYAIFSLFMGAVIYPVFGHWAWGNAFLPDNKPWLATLGYVDFAGSSVVHMVGGAASLVGVWFVGPRMGLFASDGSRIPLAANNITLSAAGTLILWFGWWGFNGGSTLAMNDQVGPIIFNTNLAGAAGGLVAIAHCVLFQDSRGAVEKVLGGALGGLVAITANCHIVSPWSALAIGAIAGLLHNLSLEYLARRFDDVVGAIPVHLVCGAWGILAVALFGKHDLLPNPFWTQLGVQLLGVVVCLAWTAGMTFIAFTILRASMQIRVSPLEEIHGHIIGTGEARS